MQERLQKIIAAAGICSRRAAEAYLSEGRVTVNGRAAALGDKADTESDEILLDGVPVTRPLKLVYVMLNKPRGYVTTMSDERGRKTVADLTGDVGVRVLPVGRLDYDSEGLLLMTNDGALIQKLTHPRYQRTKIYHVSVCGALDHAAQRLESVRDLDGEPIRQAQVRLLSQREREAELEVTIHEGKNRQIRRMCSQCGLTVRRLQRVEEDTVRLGGLKPGKWRYLTAEEIQKLKEAEMPDG